MSWQGDARPVTWINIGTTITLGGTSQPLVCGSGPIRAFFIQNPSTATESIFFEPNGVAVISGAGLSMEVTPGGYLTFGPGTIFFGNAPQINAATSGHRFIAHYGV